MESITSYTVLLRVIVFYCIYIYINTRTYISNTGKYLKAIRLEWSGHVRWADCHVLVENLNKKGLKGRPRQRWMNRVMKDAKGVDDTITMEMVRNCDRWKDSVEACKRLAWIKKYIYTRVYNYCCALSSETSETLKNSGGG